MIVLNLLPLLWFKYSGFLAGTFEPPDGAQTGFTAPGLPAGISFFTFQAMSYVIDVYRGRRSRSGISSPSAYTFRFFRSWWPGPSCAIPTWRAAQRLTPAGLGSRCGGGLRRFRRPGEKGAAGGHHGPLWGQMNADFTEAGALGAWLGLLAFSFQIFFDFSGYSDMALGLGEAWASHAGNFDRPYRARSLTDFWRQMAHHPDHLVPGLCLHPAGRQPLRRGGAGT